MGDVPGHGAREIWEANGRTEAHPEEKYNQRHGRRDEAADQASQG